MNFAKKKRKRYKQILKPPFFFLQAPTKVVTTKMPVVSKTEEK